VDLEESVEMEGLVLRLLVTRMVVAQTVEMVVAQTVEMLKVKRDDCTRSREATLAPRHTR
jgi:hypothetical protein